MSTHTRHSRPCTTILVPQTTASASRTVISASKTVIFGLTPKGEIGIFRSLTSGAGSPAMPGGLPNTTPGQEQEVM
ncbi:MAG: hypothetical protein OXU29_04070, partial [Gammaproteobacteria bacterium]|nr:hypothetical protein [Gammaproteobacteria bacterium]